MKADLGELQTPLWLASSQYRPLSIIKKDKSELLTIIRATLETSKLRTHYQCRSGNHRLATVGKYRNQSSHYRRSSMYD